MHGQLPRNLEEKLVRKEQSKCGDIKGETESIIVAAQGQAIDINCCKDKVLKEEIDGYVNNMKKLLTI